MAYGQGSALYVIMGGLSLICRGNSYQEMITEDERACAVVTDDVEILWHHHKIHILLVTGWHKLYSDDTVCNRWLITSES
jgi:hypothetical protein